MRSLLSVFIEFNLQVKVILRIENYRNSLTPHLLTLSNTYRIFYTHSNIIEIQVVSQTLTKSLQKDAITGITSNKSNRIAFGYIESHCCTKFKFKNVVKRK